MIEPIDMTALRVNPNIQKVVSLLRITGFDTCDSGDGETHDCACDLPYPYVHITTTPESLVTEAIRLRHLIEGAIGCALDTISVPPDEEGLYPIQASYDPGSNTAHISLFFVHDRMLINQ